MHSLISSSLYKRSTYSSGYCLNRSLKHYNFKINCPSSDVINSSTQHKLVFPKLRQKTNWKISNRHPKWQTIIHSKINKKTELPWQMFPSLLTTVNVRRNNLYFFRSCHGNAHIYEMEYGNIYFKGVAFARGQEPLLTNCHFFYLYVFALRKI